MRRKFYRSNFNQPIKPMPMDSLTSNYDVVMTLLISGILGALGQGIRVWFGLSELIYNKSSLVHAAFAGNMNSGSIFIGYASGICFSLLWIFPNGFTTATSVITVAFGFIVSDLIAIFKRA
jgi:hypothetical protein